MYNCEILLKNYQGGHINIMDTITSLIGCPTHVTGMFDCSGNSITSLVGGPQKVDIGYDCAYNQLNDLTGCASHIGGHLDIKNNRITSLVGIHKIIKSCPTIYFNNITILHGGIGLLLIENLKTISAHSNPFCIINKYLGSGTKGMMECRKELISKGYANYAKL